MDRTYARHSLPVGDVLQRLAPAGPLSFAARKSASHGRHAAGVNHATAKHPRCPEDYPPGRHCDACDDIRLVCGPQWRQRPSHLPPGSVDPDRRRCPGLGALAWVHRSLAPRAVRRGPGGGHRGTVVAGSGRVGQQHGGHLAPADVVGFHGGERGGARVLEAVPASTAAGPDGDLRAAAPPTAQAFVFTPLSSAAIGNPGLAAALTTYRAAPPAQQLSGRMLTPTRSPR